MINYKSQLLRALASIYDQNIQGISSLSFHKQAWIKTNLQAQHRRRLYPEEHGSKLFGLILIIIIKMMREASLFRENKVVWYHKLFVISTCTT